MNQRIQLSDHFTTSRILRFAASPIIMMVFTSIYSVVDGFFVSNFAGKQAFAAVNLIMPFLQAFGCIGFMLGTGGSALVAMTLGTGNKKRANELFSMLVCATAVLGVIFTVVALLVLRPAAVLLGATAELLDLVRHHHHGVPDGVYAAIFVPELFHHGRKTQAGPFLYRGSRPDQHGAGLCVCRCHGAWHHRCRSCNGD